MHKQKNFPKDELLFLPLGGSGEIGMNLNLYGYQNKWLMVDLGVLFGNDLGIDVWMPDTRFIEEQRRDLVGLVLTHAHEDHIGAVPHLWDRLKCPIYATPFTVRLVREKLKEVGLLNKVPLHEVPLGGTIHLDPFHIEFVTLTHSIPEPNALAIRTKAGTVVHTGDWKIDPEPLVGEKTDVKKLKQLGDEGVLALVCDSTNVFVEGRTGSEEDVRARLCEVVAKTTSGRIAVACFASNVARLESAAVAAKKAGRKVVVVGRSLTRIAKAARESGYLKGIPEFLDESQAKKLPAEEILLICTGSQGEPRSALTRIAAGQHPHVRLNEGDTVIFSSRIIPGNELPIKALYDQLIERGINVINEKLDHEIHVSGHPARADLKDMYEWIRPEILVPVHGENAHLREQAAFAQACGITQTCVPRNGLLMSLNPKNLGVITEVPHGRLALDGNVLIPEKDPELRDRKKLMNSGIVMVTLAFKKRKGVELKDPPLVSLLGVVEEKGQEALKRAIKMGLQEALLEAPEASVTHEDQILEFVRVSTRRIVNNLRGKKPLVVVHGVRGA